MKADMTEYVEAQIKLQDELAGLAKTHVILRNLYLNNFSADLLAAMESIAKRMQLADQELDAAIFAQQVDESIPVISLTLKKKPRI